MTSLSKKRGPEYVSREVFLKVIIEGSVSLFRYKGKDMINYFVKKDSAMIPLIYKTYRGDDRRILINSAFRQQLVNILGNPEMEIMRTNYHGKDLAELIINYHKGLGSPYTDFSPKPKKGQFSLTLRPGAGFSRVTLGSSFYSLKQIDCGVNPYYRIGVEAEFMLPFQKRKFSIAIEPTFSYYEATGAWVNDYRADLKYNAIEVPLGFRYRQYTKNGSAFFINGFFQANFEFDSKIDFSKNGFVFYTTRPKRSGNASLGFGYKIKKRLSMEARYQLRRNLVSGYMNPFAVILGYTIL
jgi:hypothetical protein